jgi:hypothetical protein
LTISNGTREYSKRLYFNRASLPLGFIDIRLQDRLSIKFSVLNNAAAAATNDNNGETVQEYVYEVGEDEMTGVSDSCKGGEAIPLKSWVAQVVGFSLQYQAGAAAGGQRKTAVGQNSMFNQTGISKMNQTGLGRGNNTTMNGFGVNTTQGFGLSNNAPYNSENYLLEGVALELELKSSDFATVISKNLIEAAIL